MDEQLVLSSATSALSLALHPLPILNISEHFTREKVQGTESLPRILGVLLGTQTGRDIEIVNSFELPLDRTRPGIKFDHDFFTARREEYKQVFPSIDFIGWYTVAAIVDETHVAVHEQFSTYSSTPLVLFLQPRAPVNSQSLPIKVYEPTVEIRERRSRTVFVDVPYTVETGEAERIAVDFTGKGSDQTASLASHLSSQRAAVQMLHDRIQVLVRYVTAVVEGKAKKDPLTLRALASLVASIPASENVEFRKEFDTEFQDVQLTAYLSALTSAANALNELVDKHIVHTYKAEERSMGPSMGMGGPRRRAMGFGGMGMGMGMGLRGHDMDRY